MSINSANLIETYTFISSKEVITTGGIIVQNQIRPFLWEKTKANILLICLYTGNYTNIHFPDTEVYN